MIIINQEALHTCVEVLKENGKLKITGLTNANREEVVKILNILSHYYPGLALSLSNLQQTIITIPSSNNGGVAVFTAEGLIEKVMYKDQDLIGDNRTMRQNLSGLLYSPYSDTPLFFSKATSTLLKSNTEIIPSEEVSKYLDGAINLKEKFLKQFMPAVYLLESQKSKTIKISQEARGFTQHPKVGDEVKIRPYEELIAEYGEQALSNKVYFAKKQNPIYGVPFIKPLEFLTDFTAVITKVNQTTGVVSLHCNDADGKNIFDITEVIVDGEMFNLSAAVVYHETHLIKV